ncbi:hypothetical protein E4P82_20495 [Candidatus Competibacter phosphatis]|uniref:Uncharacterized protein n=1 Tax=Candidatus Competibacter phosphatis TaxID=221280 RepID=A0ABX1TPL6_9GAMM|nr:hypothetical protein [Candidatus Competibacter phosphatis]NMQ21372.1 hypothetical protein [Candidatus Competibacter phosphatis]
MSRPSAVVAKYSGVGGMGQRPQMTERADGQRGGQHRIPQQGPPQLQIERPQQVVNRGGASQAWFGRRVAALCQRRLGHLGHHSPGSDGGSLMHRKTRQGFRPPAMIIATLFL